MPPNKELLQAAYKRRGDSLSLAGELEAAAAEFRAVRRHPCHHPSGVSVGDREYRAIPGFAGSEVEAALERNDPEELSIVVLSVALHAVDAQSAQDLCIRLASHADANVRGNAIQGLAHVARLHGVLEEARARPVIEAALKDPEDWVRGAAEHARDDLEVFLEWAFQD